MSVLIFLAGIVAGWLVTTLIEWLWFRSKRTQMQDAQMAVAEQPVVAPPPAAPAVSEIPEQPEPELPVEDEAEAVVPPDPVRHTTLGVPPPAVREVEETAEREESVTGQPAGAVDVIPKTVTDGKLTDFLNTNQNYPDDFTRIKGIGAVYQRKLYRSGIATWHQLATRPGEEVAAAAEAIEAANVAAWQEQATELARANGREAVIYTGPVPDALSEIGGISAGIEGSLYRGGILTFGQLAAAQPEPIQAILAHFGRRTRADVADWIRAAAERA